ncbi:MAG: hypothetical protein JXA71_13825 [Chitinispirillaceae bacterium]|nr:hypothetical protein [Chitinispirillaceae bacterium]
MKPRNVLLPLFVIAFLAAALYCEGKGKNTPSLSSSVQTISGAESIKNLIDTSGDRLLMFDLFADWCMPCRILSPLIETIARENRSRVSVYKIDVDKNPDIASVFSVQGIPYVVLIKNRIVVQAFTGVQPKDAYVRAIAQYGATVDASAEDRPDGELVNGVRVIRISTVTTPGNLNVYRGEEVKIVVEKVDLPYSIHIPAFSIEKSAVVGQDLEVEFKAVETGVFPFFCNGDCPVGDGQRFGQIVVLEYAVNADKKEFRSVNAKKAMEYVKKENPLILDVRTPHEFYQGYIPGAKLIPIYQLADRLGEIAGQKNRPVLVYCRSGNRSIPASQILIRNGFRKVYNMRGGVLEWEKAGGELAR